MEKVRDRGKWTCLKMKSEKHSFPAHNSRKIRCPWCGRWYTRSDLTLADHIGGPRLNCICGYWTEYLDPNLICATGRIDGTVKIKKGIKIKWFKKAPVPKFKKTKCI